jgi:phenylacetate-CoA ligase
MSCAHAHPFGLYGGGWHFSHGLEALGVLNVPLGPPSTPQQVDLAVEVWRRVRPTQVRLFGNAAAKFAESARRRGLDPARDLSLTVEGESPRAQYRTVSAGLEALGMLGSACAQDDGAHVCEDLAIVEVLDRQTRRPVGDGERGILVVTTLEKDNLLLRYDLEDVVRTNYRPCPCGETHVRLFWEGRLKDVVIAAGREVLPIDVSLALAAVPTLGPAEYQLVRRRRDDGALHVRLEAPPGAAADVERLLGERFGLPVRVECLAAGALPRFDFKAARVVDE